MTDNGANSDRFDGNMRGQKASVYEGGIRVPLFIRWQGHIRPGTRISEMAAHIDLVPTIVGLCGLARPETKPLDGLSLAPLLRAEASVSWPDRMMFTHQSRRGAVQKFPGSVRTQRYMLVNTGKRYELYDMLKDPSQENNIAEELPEVTERLAKAYDEWFVDVTSEGFERMPIPVGYPGRSTVECPAPEAHLRGGVKFKGGMGWANDWITNWRNTDDAVSWDIDVVRPGRFHVALLYTSPVSEVGSRVQVRIGTGVLEAVVDRAHDPDPIPSPDRIERGEVFEKDWAKLSLGELNLSAGRARLTLSAPHIANEQALDLKAVRIRAIDEL
jgi:arylsulfatase A